MDRSDLGLCDRHEKFGASLRQIKKDICGGQVSHTTTDADDGPASVRSTSMSKHKAVEAWNQSGKD